MFVPDLLSGKRILVTGGGSGLGKSVARRMASLGAEVFICGRRLAVLEETAAELAADGMTIHPIRCDITKGDEVNAMMDEIWATGPLDGLVNNAAGTFVARTEDLSFNAFDSVVRIVLNGTAYCTLAAGKRWIAAGHKGVILNVLLTGAVNGKAFIVPSVAAKAGVLAMMKSLAVEWGPKGIRTVAVAPGYFPTPGAWQQLFTQTSADQQLASVPLGRFGDHGEFADLCSFLVSDGASYINGDMIAIDGGKGLKGMDVDDMLSWDDDKWASMRPKKKPGAAAGKQQD